MKMLLRILLTIIAFVFLIWFIAPIGFGVHNLGNALGIIICLAVIFRFGFSGIYERLKHLMCSNAVTTVLLRVIQIGAGIFVIYAIIVSGFMVYAMNVKPAKDDTAILTLMKEYYTAIAANDTAALSSLVDPWDDLSKEHIRFSDDIESYNDISTYSAAGINDGEYVVFNSYYSKIKGIDTLVPTMVVVYVKTAQDGTLKIYSYEDRDTAVADYVTKVSSQENVRELISKVNNEYQQAIASDSALASYLNGEKTTESGDAGTAAAGSSMVSNADLNIRQEPGTDANVIGVVPSGETVEVVAQADDGWVQINYVTQAGTVTGYVKSEYLTSASGSTVAETSSTSGTAAGSGTGTQDTAANGTGTSSQGSVQLTSEGDGSSTAA